MDLTAASQAQHPKQEQGNNGLGGLQPRRSLIIFMFCTSPVALNCENNVGNSWLL